MRLLYAITALFICTEAGAAELPCGIKSVQLRYQSIEVEFSEKADWTVVSRGLSGDYLIRSGKVLYFDDANVMHEQPPYRLTAGEQLNLHIPHISCTLIAVVGDVSRGLIVRASSSLPGIRRTQRYDFVPADEGRSAK